MANIQQSQISSIAKGFKKIFLTPQESTNGISSFGNVRFWIVLCCYVGSFLIMAHDPVFMKRYHWVMINNIIPLLLAFVLAAALNWEMMMTGKPSGANLLLQAIMIAPLALILSRMMVLPSPEDPSWWESIIDSAKDIGKAITGPLLKWVPSWIISFFAHPWDSLLLILVLLVLCLHRNALKLSALAMILLIGFSTTLMQIPQCSFFLLAILLFSVGLTLQWCNYGKALYYCNVLQRINSPIDDREAKVIFSAMDRIRQDGQLTPGLMEILVQQNYSLNGQYDDNQVKLIATEISKQMVGPFNLVTIETNANGSYMRAVSGLNHAGEYLAWLTAIPRITTAFLIGLLWCAMPLDLIPDYIPFIGLFDDLTVCTLATFIFKNSKPDLKKTVQINSGE